MADSIADITGFQIDTLPFRYLGIPISAKKLTKHDCECLIEKMTARIRVWSARNLSYAGRIQLVNSILLSLHTYWATILILPRAVLKRITDICRSYIWDGKADTNRSPLIAWDIICKPKKSGGLGNRDVFKWNDAAICKYVWNIAKKADLLWVKWVAAVYITRKEWWEYKPATNASWYWRQVCIIKDKFKNGFVQDRCSGMPSGHYTIASGYHWIQGRDDAVHWQRWVWNRTNLPKHAFLSWLTMHNRLQVKERLHRYGISDNDKCAICAQEVETHKHLFFTCHFSVCCMKNIFEWLKLNTTSQDIYRIWRWVDRRCNGNKLRRQIIYSSLSALVHHVWRVRNEARIYQRIPCPNQVSERIKQEIRGRVHGLYGKKIQQGKLNWFLELN